MNCIPYPGNRRFVARILMSAIIFLVSILSYSSVQAQTGVFFRSNGYGEWTDVSIWEWSTDSITWEPASRAPQHDDSTILIRASNTVSINNDLDIDDVIIRPGGTLYVNASLERYGSSTRPLLTVYGEVYANSYIAAPYIEVFGRFNIYPSHITTNLIIRESGSLWVENQNHRVASVENYGTIIENNTLVTAVITNYGEIRDQTSYYTAPSQSDRQFFFNYGVYKKRTSGETEFGELYVQDGILTGIGGIRVRQQNPPVSYGHIVPGYDGIGHLRILKHQLTNTAPSINIRRLDIELFNTTGPGFGHDLLTVEADLSMDSLVVVETGPIPYGRYKIVESPDTVIADVFETTILPPNYAVEYYPDSIVLVKTAPIIPGTGIFFRTTQSGDWKNLSIWEQSADSINWTAAATYPIYTDSSINIRNGHHVTIDSVALNELTIEAGATLSTTDGGVMVVKEGNSPFGIANFGIIHHNSELQNEVGIRIYASGRLVYNYPGIVGLGNLVNDGELEWVRDSLKVEGGLINNGLLYQNYQEFNNRHILETNIVNNGNFRVNEVFRYIQFLNSPVVNNGVISGAGYLSGFVVTNNGTIYPGTPTRPFQKIQMTPSTPFKLNKLKLTIGPEGTSSFLFEGRVDLDGTDTLEIIETDTATAPGRFDIMGGYPFAGDFAYRILPDRYYIQRLSPGGISIFKSGPPQVYIYRSTQSGNWNDVSNWEWSTDSISWSAAPRIPEFDDSSIVIMPGHTITINTNKTIDEIVAVPGGTLNINAHLETFSYRDRPIVSGTGTINMQGGSLSKDMLVEGTLNFSGGYLQGTTIGASGILNITAAVTRLRQFHNYGIINEHFRLVTETSSFNYGLHNLYEVDEYITRITYTNYGKFRKFGNTFSRFTEFWQEGVLSGSGKIGTGYRLFGFTEIAQVIPGDTAIGYLEYGKPYSGTALPVHLRRLDIQLQNTSGPGIGHDLLAVGAISINMDSLFVTELTNLPNGNYTIFRLLEGTIADTFEFADLPVGYSLKYYTDSIVLQKGSPIVLRNITISTPAAITEGNTGQKELKFPVRLNAASTGTVTVNYSTIDSTTNLDVDYVSTSGTLTFAPGQLRDTIRVLINGDAYTEADEYFKVQLSNAFNANITTGTATGTIRNDDSYPALTITNYNFNEGNTTDSVLQVKLRLNKRYPDTVRVQYATIDSTTLAGADYIASSGTAVFLPGDTLAFIPVTIIGDRIDEPNEIVQLQLSNPVNVTIGGTGLGRITIIDNDLLPQVIFTNVNTTEQSNDQFNAINYTVRLNRSYPLPVSVRIRTVDSTAMAGIDYLSLDTTVVFAADDTLEAITIGILGDRFVESTEIIKLVLESPVNATVPANPSRISITNDDTYPSLIITSTSITEGDASDVNAQVTVRLNKRYPAPVTVQFGTTTLTATSAVDYADSTGNLVFDADGDTLKTIIIRVLPDLIDEVNETFRVQLSSSTNSSISGTGYATVTITDNDPVPAIRIYDTVVSEISGTALVRIGLNNVSAKIVKVNYYTTEGTARDTLDYTRVVLDSVIFQPGETVKYISISIVADGLTESNETFSIILQSPVNGTITTAQGGDNRADITIQNAEAFVGVNRMTAMESKELIAAIKIPGIVNRGMPFRILGLPRYEEVTIYTVSGQLLKQYRNYNNNQNLSGLTPGTYVCLVRYRNAKGEWRKEVGRFVVVE